MTFRKLLLATAILALPAVAQAQQVNGLYVAASAGVNWRNSSDFDAAYGFGSGPAVFPQSFSVNTDAGLAVLGSVGWGFGNGLRVEVEGSYRNNTVSGGSYRYPGESAFGFSPTNGSISTSAIMANALYEFRLGPVQPYLGAGIGYAWTRMGGVGGQEGPGGDFDRFSGTGGAFAWQVIAGIAVPVRAVPGLAITAEYRYFASGNTNHGGSWIGEFGSGQLNAQGVSNQHQTLLAGVRYNFGRAPSAPPPVAAVAPATSFIVFFDFNRSDLTARAREIVAQAAAAARSQQVTRIEVAGHTDTVGSAQYNMGLSQRRANTVAAELVRLGVPRDAIQTAGYGFSRPLVATGPNVREPQNRRVEIVFR